jgi:hypothetical protein
LVLYSVKAKILRVKKGFIMLNTEIKTIDVSKKFEIKNNRLYFKDIKVSQHFKSVLNEILSINNLNYKAKVKNGHLILYSTIANSHKEIIFNDILYFDFVYYKFVTIDY